MLGEESVTVVDPDPACREAMQTAHPGIMIAETTPWNDIEAVVVAVPAVLHHDIAAEALRAGKHVLVEKPMTLSSEDARNLIDLAGARGCILMVDHLLEYHPAVTRLKALMDAGDLGRPLHLTSRRINLGVVRTEENALWSLAPHDISVILYLLGGMPKSISAQGAAYLQPGIPDIAHLTMAFDDDTLAYVHVSWLDPIKTRALTMVGTEGMALMDDAAEQKLTFFPKRVVRDKGRFVPESQEARPIPVERAEPLRTMAEAFLRSLETGASPRTDGWDGWRVVRVLEAAQESLGEGGLPVRMELSYE